MRKRTLTITADTDLPDFVQDFMAGSAPLLLALAYIAVGPSLIAYRCWGRAVAETGPAVTGFFMNLTPLFAALLGSTLIGAHPEAFHGLAFVLIAAGILVSSRH